MDPVPDGTLGGHAGALDHHEHDERQRPGHGQVPGGGALPGIERERRQADQVAEEDEEEQRPEEAEHLPAPLGAEPGIDDLVPDPHHRELEQPEEALLRRSRGGLPGHDREQHHGEYGDPDEQPLVGAEATGVGVVEEVVDDVFGGEEHHTASRAVLPEAVVSERSTRIISTPR